MINMSNDVVSRNDVPFGISKTNITKFYTSTQFPSTKKGNFVPIID